MGVTEQVYLRSSQSSIPTPFDPPRRLFLLRASAENASILCPRFGVGSVKGALLRRLFANKHRFTCAVANLNSL